jgi:hypothetical protein
MATYRHPQPDLPILPRESSPAVVGGVNVNAVEAAPVVNDLSKLIWPFAASFVLSAAAIFLLDFT